jgi:hypothetical protein
MHKAIADITAHGSSGRARRHRLGVAGVIHHINGRPGPRVLYPRAEPLLPMASWQAMMQSESSFTCPHCRAITTDPALARLGYCGNCHEFTGLCGAASLAVALLATGVVTMPGWPHPCTTAGTECWQVTGTNGVATRILLCSSHGERMRGGAISWMERRGLKLAFEGTCRSRSVDPGKLTQGGAGR